MSEQQVIERPGECTGTSTIPPRDVARRISSVALTSLGAVPTHMTGEPVDRRGGRAGSNRRCYGSDIVIHDQGDTISKVHTGSIMMLQTSSSGVHPVGFDAGTRQIRVADPAGTRRGLEGE